MADRIRLDRFLADAGIGSRSEVKKLIRAGKVLVNGKTTGQGDQKIDPDADEIRADGRPVSRLIVPTIMLNKPAGVVSATTDTHDRTVLDLIHEPWAEKLFPVGRLDKDTEGLLLLTGDGKMSHDLLSPRRHVLKTYYVVVSGDPDPDLIRRFREGIDIGEKKKTLPAGLWFLQKDEAGYTCGGGEIETDEERRINDEDPGIIPAVLRSISSGDYSRCGENECLAIVSVTEGKFHQIKRMFGACGREVHFLKRIAMGNLMLDPALSPGQYRPLSEEETGLLRIFPEQAK